MKENEFKNIFDNTGSNNSKSFTRNILVPFISGVLGCTLVIGTCFKVPTIKEKLIGGVSSSNS